MSSGERPDEKNLMVQFLDDINGLADSWKFLVEHRDWMKNSIYLQSESGSVEKCITLGDGETNLTHPFSTGLQNR